MRRFWVSSVLVISLLLTGVLVVGAQEMDDACAPEAVLASFGAAEDVPAWQAEVLAGDCSMRVKNAVVAMVSAYNSMIPVEFGPSPYVDLEQSVTEEGFPMLGSADAPMSIAMYESFGCGYCAQFSDNQFQEMLANVAAGEINVAFVMVTNQFSVAASVAGVCAQEQDMFWEMHDILFNLLENYGQEAFDINRIMLVAEDLGLDMDAFQACMNDSATYEVLDVANEAFYALSEDNEGVTGTPTITFNGEPPEFGSGSVPLEFIQEQIAAAQEG
ncbi:DsbA family protein [Chloroflexota bacterium]